jgi:apolipoprotein N-acyltransferase
MPYQEILPFTKSLVEWGVGLSSWQIGRDTNIFILKDGTKFNTAICYESVYPEFFAGFVDKGADFSVIITNDGWWGKFFGTYQHNRFAVFRAVENRRWIARCANTGISDFIDPYGNYYEETMIDEKINIVFNAGIRKEKTFYTMNGDIFSKICLLSGVIFFAISFMLKSRSNANPKD